MFLFNSLGRQVQKFKSREPKSVKIFTCGPSVYQRPHIGNYRTFLYEDVLVRYLEYQGYNVKRAMNLTDIEDKAVSLAIKEGHNVFEQTAPSITQFEKDIKTLKIKKPIIAMASTSVKEAIMIIEKLLEKGFAYNYKGSIFFDPLKNKEFGKLYGLDKSKWPKKRIRYKLDTYPGMRWNLGDFILWHKVDDESEHTQASWDSPWGKGRPSWNVQDPAMILQTLGEQVDINCGGIDNIIRHHDYNIAIMESTFGKTYANYYMHGAHLYMDGKKMSKSLGNITYPDDLIEKGYKGEDIRFFLIAVKHYRSKLNFTQLNFQKAQKQKARFIQALNHTLNKENNEITNLAQKLEQTFNNAMDNDLNLKQALDNMYKLFLKNPKIHKTEIQEVKNIILKIDTVLQIGLL